jgi:hypothetical protein
VNSILSGMFLISLTLAVAGCSKPTDVNKVAPPKFQAADGGFDSGGGSGIGDKPIESFIWKDLLKSEEYVRFIQPRLVRLDSILPSFADELRLVFKEGRSWYKVPVKLTPLENHVISAPLKESTTRIALHTPTSIWINQELYDSAPDITGQTSEPLDSKSEARAVLLMHEAVMALLVNQRVRQREKRLSASDYESVRRLVDIVMFKTDSYDAKKLHSFLSRQGFMGLNRNHFPMPLRQEHSFKSTHEIAAFLNSANAGVNVATQCSDLSMTLPQISTPSGERCEYQITNESIRISDGTSSERVRFADFEIISRNHSTMTLFVLDEPISRIATNNETRALKLVMSGNRIESLGIQRLKSRGPLFSQQDRWAPMEELVNCTLLPHHID